MNGYEWQVSLRNVDASVIERTLARFRNSTGHSPKALRDRVLTEHPSIQGTPSDMPRVVETRTQHEIGASKQ